MYFTMRLLEYYIKYQIFQSRFYHFHLCISGWESLVPALVLGLKVWPALLEVNDDLSGWGFWVLFPGCIGFPLNFFLKTRRLGIRLIDYRYKPACERLVVSICGPVMDWRTVQDVICPPVAAEIVFSPRPSPPRPWRWMTNDIVLNYILYIHHLCTNLG